MVHEKTGTEFEIVSIPVNAEQVELKALRNNSVVSPFGMVPISGVELLINPCRNSSKNPVKIRISIQTINPIVGHANSLADSATPRKLNITRKKIQRTARSVSYGAN